MTVEQLVQKYLPAAEWVLKKHLPFHLQRNWADKEHYRSAALEALVRAAKTYRPEMKVKFLTYAVKVMRRQIHNELLSTQRQKRQGVVRLADLPFADQRQWDYAVTKDPQPQWIERDHNRRLVERLLRCKKLTPEQREIGRLLWIEGLNAEEVCERMGLEKRVFRIRYNSIVLMLKKVFVGKQTLVGSGDAVRP